MKGTTQNQESILTLSGEVSANPEIKRLVEMCGDCVDFDMCDFVNFSVFFAGSKAFGTECTDKIRRDAILAWSLGLALIFEHANAGTGNETLGDSGVCTIIKKISSLINKCCSLPEFYGPSKSDKTNGNDRPSGPGEPNGSRLNKTSTDIVNERLGLTPHSTKTQQENIKLDPSYIANCSAVQEMVPGANILGLKVIGMAHNGKNISVKRDNCLKAGKIWNTLNNTCYCLDEKDTPNVVVGDRKVDKKYFHLSPPKNWSGVSRVEELNLDEKGIKRFTDIISKQENVDLNTLQLNKCAVDTPCKWYSCLINGITNYFLGCSSPNTGTISACYYDYNLMKSDLSTDVKNQILNTAQNSFRHCCDKCHQSGCKCNKIGDGCECVGVDNKGMPCNQITVKSAGRSLLNESSPVLRTDAFDSDVYVTRTESRLVTCCDRSVGCPPGVTDAQCCEELCSDDFYDRVIAKIPPSQITRVRNVNPDRGIEWKCTSHDDCSFGCCDSYGACGGSKPCPGDDDDDPASRVGISSDVPLIPNTPDTGLFGCCTRRDGCCTCKSYLTAFSNTQWQLYQQPHVVTWGCCCVGNTKLRRCCRRRGYGSYGPSRPGNTVPTTYGQ